MALIGSSIDPVAIEKAEARAQALGTDLTNLSERLRDAQPGQINSLVEQEDRRRFLHTLHSGGKEAELQFERIISGNELQQANFLPRGALAARAVVRVVIRALGGRVIGYGTGFLVGDGVLITNNHVLPDSSTAAASEVEAYFEEDVVGTDAPVQRYAIEPQRLFHTSARLDFTLVAVAPETRSGDKLAAIGWLPLIGSAGKALEGEWLTIVQHPMGERKQLCIRENQLLKRDTDVLWYSTDTLGGSSGSPVFNNDWLVVALHHSGVPECRDGHWQTIDGRDFRPGVDDEERIKWKANEGIRVSRIVETLRGDGRLAAHPMIRPILALGPADIGAGAPILFRDGRALPRIEIPVPHDLAASLRSKVHPAPSPPSLSGDAPMSQRLITIAINDDGDASIVQQGVHEADFIVDEASKPKKNVIHAPVNPVTDWVSGYDPEFLGKGSLTVPLPEIRDKAKIAPLLDAYGQTFSQKEKDAGVLKYNGYCVVMNKERRFAFYSAANVSWDMRPAINGRADDWLFDDRIDRDHQCDDSLYRSNKFDRGHLTRREDMEYGKSAVDATRRANGTCTWTNCTPQHAIFNQDKHPDKTIHLWHGLERYILEETVEQDQFSVQLFTGPIFGVADPEYRGIKVPLDFWKVVVAIAKGGKLFATGHVLGQKDVIDQFGTEAAKEVPFGNYGMYQRPIRLIENLTGLTFTYGSGKSLHEIDPLEKPTWRPRRRVRAREAFGVDGDDSLNDFSDIVLV